MEKLIELYKKMSDNSILCFNHKFDVSDAATIEIDNRYSIFADFDSFETKHDEFAALVHEYGHCISGATHKLYSRYDIIDQHENRANRAAVHEFLPCSKILNAMKQGYTEVWQIAECLDVPDEFVTLAIEIYTAEQCL